MPDKQTTEPRGRESGDEKLLRQIREDFAYVRSYWRENYEEAAKDMDCMAALPPREFSDDRAGRPCIWPDETSQYVNQANNNLRQNQRSIKLSPKGDEATDQDAEHRQAYIRGIEDASKAPSVYTTGYESAVQCAFGYWRVTTKVTGPKGEQEPRLERIPNWSTVYPDPDAKESDFSDSAIYFVIQTMRESAFARKYPKAKIRSFTEEQRAVAPDWLNGGNVVIAEYWTRETIEEPDGEKSYKVTRRVTNGVEILETAPWIGSWIPIIGCFGKEMYIKQGGQSKRLFLSMIRRGRPAQQMMAYIASQEAEEFGMMPRSPFVGYKGTFVNADKTWKLANKVPISHLEVDIPLNWPPNFGPPPLPSRPQFEPHPQAYEIAYERWRRSHQAAVAGTPLPTDAQKQNDKSGVALERIENSGMLGNYHFLDNFGQSLRNTGDQINELITKLAQLDSLPKQLLGKDAKGEDLTLHVVAKGFVPPESSEHLPEAEYFFAHRGRFAVTISEGPHYQSQREEQSKFVDVMMQTLPSMGLPPAILQEVMAIAVKMKNIGTYGDEIAELLSPPDANKLPPQTKAILAQAQGQMQLMQQELQKLQLEKLGKVTEMQGKMAIADKEGEIKLAIAAFAAKLGTIEEATSTILAAMKDLHIAAHDSAHELAMQSQQHQHESQMADKQALIGAAQQDAGHAQTMEQQTSAQDAAAQQQASPQ